MSPLGFLSQSSLKVFTTLVISFSLYHTYSSTLCSLTSAHLTLLKLSGQGQQVHPLLVETLFSIGLCDITFTGCSSLSLVTFLQLLCYYADLRIQCSVLGGLLFSLSTASLNNLTPLMASMILSFNRHPNLCLALCFL